MVQRSAAGAQLPAPRAGQRAGARTPWRPPTAAGTGSPSASRTAIAAENEQPGAVGVPGGHPGCAQQRGDAAGVQHVDRLARRRRHRRSPPRAPGRRRRGPRAAATIPARCVHRASGEGRGLRAVRRRHPGVRQQPLDGRRPRPSRCPLVATSTGSTTSCGSRPSRAASATASATAGVPSIPVFTARTAKSASTLSNCSVTVRGGSGRNGVDAPGVLRGDRGEDAGAVRAQRGEDLEVGLDAGAAAGVGAGDGEDRRRRHRFPFVAVEGCVGSCRLPGWRACAF